MSRRGRIGVGIGVFAFLLGVLLVADAALLDSSRAFGPEQIAEIQGRVPLRQSTIVSVLASARATAEFHCLLADDNAEAIFSELAAHGSSGGRMLALCGLEAIGSIELVRAIADAASDERQVWLHTGGCVTRGARLRDAVEDPEFWWICESIVNESRSASACPSA